MKKRSVFSITLVVVLLILAAVALLVVYNKPHRSVADEETAFKVSVSELADAFSEDETKAQSLYGGRVIEVSGPLKKKIESDTTLILLMGDSTRMMGVSCYVERDQIEDARTLALGELITVKGICNGALLDVVIDNAIVMENEQ